MSKDKKIEFEMFTMDVAMTEPSETVIVEENETVKTTHFSSNKDGHRAVAIIGDRFMRGVFLPAKELEKVYKQWNGTLHDINHMGTTHLMGLGASSDIRFFVGFQKDASYDSKTKEVSMNIHVNENTLYGKAWRSYVELCKEAGMTPNVSVAFLGKRGKMKAKDLPEGVEYAAYGLEDDDEIEYIYDIQPRALSTVLRGACNDKDGCGINNECKDGKCDLSQDDYEKRRQEIIKQLKKEDINND